MIIETKTPFAKRIRILFLLKRLSDAMVTMQGQTHQKE